MKKLGIIGASIAALALVGGGCVKQAPVAPAPQQPAPAAQAPVAPVQKFAVGARVESRWKDGTIWYKGTIATFSDEKYFINYDDGDKEAAVPESRIRALAEAEPTAAAATFTVGARVESRWRDGSIWYKGTIKEAANGAYSIDYDDGSKESSIPASRIRTLNTAEVKVAAPAAKELFPVGDKVVAKWKNGNQWYPGKVSAAADGKYSIVYDDGSKEASLSSSFLAHIPTSPLAAKTGDAIIAKWKDGRWYTASVIAVAGSKISVKFYDGYTLEVTGMDIAVAGK